MSANTFHGQTAKFLATVATCMPPMSSEVMQGWIDNPRALKKALTCLVPPSVLTHLGEVMDIVLDDGRIISLNVYDVAKSTTTDVEVEGALGEHYTFLPEEISAVISALTKTQPCGEEGLLLTDDGRDNLFFTVDLVCEVNYDNCAKKWQILPLMRMPRSWPAGTRVIIPGSSRNRI